MVKLQLQQNKLQLLYIYSVAILALVRRDGGDDILEEMAGMIS